MPIQTLWRSTYQVFVEKMKTLILKNEVTFTYPKLLIECELDGRIADSYFERNPL